MLDPTKVVGRRIVAFIIDSIILCAISLAVFFAMAEEDGEFTRKVLVDEYSADETRFGRFEVGDDEYSIVGEKYLLCIAIMFAIWGLYRWVLPGLRGWTPGKLLVGIRVVGEDGRFAGVLRNAVREILLIVDDFPYFIPMLTGFVVAMATERHQRVGDLAVATFVVQKDAVGRPVVAVAPTAQAAPPPPLSPPVARRQ